MRSRAGAVLALVAVLALLVPSRALGDHGGREIGSLFTCDRPVNPPRCTSVGDGLTHFVAFDGSLTDGLADSLAQAMRDAYDAPTKLTMVVQAGPTADTDAIAFSTDYGENGAAGWVYCPTDAPQGINPAGDRWCRQQEIHFNLNPRYAVFFADDGSRDHVTCHELGHTIGLRHWGNPPQSQGTDVGETCMNANTPDGPTHLHQFDVDHINAYDYRRVPIPPSGNGARGEPQLLPMRGVVAATEAEPVPSTLHQLVASSDAVVRGRIAAVVPGRRFGTAGDGLSYASATLEVDELLGGTLPRADRSRLTLEIPLFGGPDSIRDVPARGEGVFILRNKGTSARLAGQSAAMVRSESAYYRLRTFTSLVVNDGGLAMTAADAGPLAALHERPFDAAVDALRAAAR